MRRRLTHGVWIVTLVVFALATTTAASAASIETDKQDYRPGETVAITGSGWETGEIVTLQVLHDDETPEGGEGHGSWSVTAEDGTFSTSWYVHPDDSLDSSFLLTAVGSSGQTATARFTDRLGLDLDQCQNGTLANLAVPCGQSPTAWANGNINGQNSQYREADGIPYRAAIAGIPNGTWTIRLQYDFTKGGVYAIDRLTRFNLTQNSNPCLSAPYGIGCAVGSPSFDFPIPGEVGSPTATAPALPNGGALDIAGTNASLAAADRMMAVWVQGGTGTFVSAGQNVPSFNDNRVLQSGSAAGDSAREFAFRVTLAGCPASGSNPGCSLILGWTGHVASARDWGSGRGASSIGGAPFHMRILGVDQTNGTSGGNQDRSVQLAALLDTGTIVIVKDAQPDNAQDFGFTGTLGSFSLDDDSDATLSNSRTFSGVEAGIYTVTESEPAAGWELTNLVCVDPSSNTAVDLDNATATIDLEGGETVTCTFTNSNQSLLNPCLNANCDDDNVCTDDSCNVVDGAAVCSNTPNTASCDDGLFCNGADVCSAGECVSAGDPCSGSGEVCDPDSSSCVECLNNGDCPAGEICDPGTNTCGECFDDEDCAEGVCDTSVNQCVECLGNGDCQTGEICDPGTNTCGECFDDEDCTEGVCDTSVNQCVECLGDTDCTPGQPVCNPGTNTCEECVNDSDCAEGVCDTSVYQCVECVANADCTDPTQPVCNSETNTCEECVDDNDCAEGVCDTALNQCVECLADTDCTDPSQPLCNPETNTCGECVNDGHCGEEVCDAQNGICVECLANADCTDPNAPACDSETNTCEECVDDNDCAEGVCDTTLNECVECLADGDCTDPSQPLCNTETNTCGECVNDEHCSGEEVCDTGNGVCVECLTNGDCTDPSAPACDTGTNTCEQCVTDEDCEGAPGLPACDENNTCVECIPGDVDFCGEGVCDPGSNQCVECLTDADCDTGQPVCDPGTNECRECSEENLSACDSGELCQTDSGICVECLTNDDCGAGAFCTTANECVSCRSNADCEDNNECTEDICNGTGECEHPPAECAVVTDSSLCRFDEFSAACEGREFKLVFTPDVKVWPGYKLSSSNPGQTFYNLITEEQSSVEVKIPYPYVTVGGMPVHVYCADDLRYNANQCFVPPGAVASHSFQISMADWAPGGRCAVPPPGGSDTYPQGVGDCTLEVPLPAGQCDGKYYVNIHLDYGLKGAAARYDAVGMSAWGSSDAYVNDQAIVAINDCTPYTFSDSGSEESDTVYSTNIFKRIAGVIGQVTNNATGNPVPGVMASLKAKPTGVVVATATSDEDGYLMLNYKHTGKAITYTVTLNVPGVGLVSTDVNLRANGWAEASYDVATGQWLVVSSSDK